MYCAAQKTDTSVVSWTLVIGILDASPSPARPMAVWIQNTSITYYKAKTNNFFPQSLSPNHSRSWEFSRGGFQLYTKMFKVFWRHSHSYFFWPHVTLHWRYVCECDSQVVTSHLTQRSESTSPCCKATNSLRFLFPWILRPKASWWVIPTSRSPNSSHDINIIVTTAYPAPSYHPIVPFCSEPNMQFVQTPTPQHLIPLSFPDGAFRG